MSTLPPAMLHAVKWFLVSVCACAEIDGYYRRDSPRQHVHRLVWTPNTLASRYLCSGEVCHWDQAHVKVEVLTHLLMSVCVAWLARTSKNFFLLTGSLYSAIVYSITVVVLLTVMNINASLLEPV